MDARNRRLLRDVNERIAELTEWNDSGVSLFVCECSDLACSDALELSAAEYAEVRADDSHFVVLPGHEQGEYGRIVARNGRFVVVTSSEPEHAPPPGSGDAAPGRASAR